MATQCVTLRTLLGVIVPESDMSGRGESPPNTIRDGLAPFADARRPAVLADAGTLLKSLKRLLLRVERARERAWGKVTVKAVVLVGQEIAAGD